MPQTQNKLLRVVLFLAAVSTVATVVIVLFGLPRIFSSADNSQAVRRGSDLQACRSAYASRVTDATTQANDLILRGLAAVGSGDEAELMLLVTDPPGPNGSPIDDARALVVERNDAYTSAVILSRSNPDAFLAACDKLEAPSRTTTTTSGASSTSTTGATTTALLGPCPETGGPFLEGEPGYSTSRDRDGNGLACE